MLYVPRLRKNILYISALDAKEIMVALINGEVVMCPRGNTIEDAIVIGEEDGGLYKLKGQLEQELVHESMNQVNFGIEGLHM